MLGIGMALCGAFPSTVRLLAANRPTLVLTRYTSVPLCPPRPVLRAASRREQRCRVDGCRRSRRRRRLRVRELLAVPADQRDAHSSEAVAVRGHRRPAGRARPCGGCRPLQLGAGQQRRAGRRRPRCGHRIGRDAGSPLHGPAGARSGRHSDWLHPAAPHAGAAQERRRLLHLRHASRQRAARRRRAQRCQQRLFPEEEGRCRQRMASRVLRCHRRCGLLPRRHAPRRSGAAARGAAAQRAPCELPRRGPGPVRLPPRQRLHVGALHVRRRAPRHPLTHSGACPAPPTHTHPLTCVLTRVPARSCCACSRAFASAASCSRERLALPRVHVHRCGITHKRRPTLSRATLGRRVPQGCCCNTGRPPNRGLLPATPHPSSQ